MSDELEFTPLVADIFTWRAKDTAAAVDRVIHDLERDKKRLIATLALIRSRIYYLVDEPMTPMIGQELLRAMQPDDADIDHYINNRMEGA